MTSADYSSILLCRSRRIVSLFIYISAVVLARGANAPILEQVDVFVAGQDGVLEYRIPGLLTSNRGTLIAFCDGRMRKQGDPPNDIDLVMKRSVDNGKSWSPLRT